MSTSQLHHYVPRFLLRRFGRGKKDQVHTYDKSNGAVFSRAANKLAAQYDYYDFEFMGKRCTVEPTLANVEAKAGSHIARILKERRLNLADPIERGELACFFAVQLVRTPAQLATGKELFSRMERWLRAEGMPEAYFAPNPHFGGGENVEKVMLAQRIVNAPRDYGLAFIEKIWVLFESESTCPYLIGDHPLVMHNDKKFDLRGNLGLNVEGIEIYFPLSPSLTLGMLCPSIRDEIEENLASIRGSMYRLRPEAGSDFSHAVRLMEAMTSGLPLEAGKEGSEFFNSLQIANAERYIFSADGDFNLVQEMVARNSSLKQGRRMKEATGKF